MYLYEPAIIKETSEGTTRYAICDAMFQRREIQCYGTVDADMVNSLIAQICYLAQEDPDKEITMYINSPGGSVPDGMALLDVMAAVPCPIRTVCVGTAASMASLIFAVGDARDMLEHARLMIHDPLVQNLSGSALEIEKASKNLLKSRETICKIYAKASGKALDEIYAMTCEDTWMDAQTALDMGFADRIIDRI